ncbi:hypothetical protein ANANG_G00313350 [Anguilla anguilla]|uniref:Uncharacterized protein n=1 Tax=Anguilla anguilla TaxID=7936 RepID=A0A9D3LJQ4_ANGAN|nr:hypothetical protein ANANG_G00313350 [Anguilla anguilla]
MLGNDVLGPDILHVYGAEFNKMDRTRASESSSLGNVYRANGSGSGETPKRPDHSAALWEPNLPPHDVSEDAGHTVGPTRTSGAARLGHYLFPRPALQMRPQA